MAGKERAKMGGKVAGIGTGTVDQRRLAAAEELQANHIYPRRLRDDAAVVDDLALVVKHRKVEP